MSIYFVDNFGNDHGRESEFFFIFFFLEEAEGLRSSSYLSQIKGRTDSTRKIKKKCMQRNLSGGQQQPLVCLSVRTVILERSDLFLSHIRKC